MKKTVHSLAGMEAFAREIVAGLEPRGSASRLVGLHGDLGAGKTAFVKGVAKALGVTQDITSPTYVIMKKFALAASDFELLIHIDAYRLESSKELLVLGWKEISENPKNIIFIEWPEKVEDILPPDMQHIYFTFIDETTREITFE